MALRPGAREPSVGSTCSDLFIALWNATRSVLQRPWWAVGACSRSSSHSVHVVVVVEAHEQDDAEKFASCLLIMCTRARHVLATRSRVSICVESVWVETRGRVPTQERTGVRATCVLVVSLACLRRPPALIARRGVREMMAPRKHEGVLPLQRARRTWSCCGAWSCERMRNSGGGPSTCVAFMPLDSLYLEPALRQYVATERLATPACDLDVERLHKVRSSVADHISK